MRRVLLLLPIVIVLGGCASPAGPVPTVTVTQRVTEPAPESAPEPTLVARSAADPLEAIDAYALCKAQTIGYHNLGDPTAVVFEEFADARVVKRDDGDWYVAIESDDPNRSDQSVFAGTESASECIVGGSIGAPVWQTFGERTRDGLDEVDPNAARGGD